MALETGKGDEGRRSCLEPWYFFFLLFSHFINVYLNSLRIRPPSPQATQPQPRPPSSIGGVFYFIYDNRLRTTTSPITSHSGMKRALTTVYKPSFGPRHYLCPIFDNLPASLTSISTVEVPTEVPSEVPTEVPTPAPSPVPTPPPSDWFVCSAIEDDFHSACPE